MSGVKPIDDSTDSGWDDVPSTMPAGGAAASGAERAEPDAQAVDAGWASESLVAKLPVAPVAVRVAEAQPVMRPDEEDPMGDMPTEPPPPMDALSEETAGGQYWTPPPAGVVPQFESSAVQPPAPSMPARQAPVPSSTPEQAAQPEFRPAPVPSLVTCERCGTRVRSAKFCECCGHPIRVEPPKFCPQCGASLRAGIRFCTNCAAPLS